MKGIITFLFEMFWHYYSLLVSMEPGDTLVELVLDDMKEIVPDWFASKTRMVAYLDPPEGSILYIIDSWCADVFGVRKDKTGLVERFGADKEKLIEYLLEKYEEG